MSTFTYVRALRAIIEQAAESLDDRTASEAPDMFPKFSKFKATGELIKAGTRINHYGTVKRAAVDLWATLENDPDVAPTLWEDLLYKNGYRIIPEVITVGTAFAKDEIGYWEKDQKFYKSLTDNNIYTPEQYAANWEVYETN